MWENRMRDERVERRGRKTVFATLPRLSLK